MDGNLTEEMLDRIRLPRVHRKCTVSQIPDKCVHKKVVQDWVDDVINNVRDSKGLMFLGDYSTGKSGLAAICLKAAADHGIIGLWVRAYDFTSQVIEKTSFDGYQTIQQRADSVSLLVIDEVQIRDKTSYVEDLIERLVRRRVDEGLCTILTTNHKKVDLEKRMKSLMAVLREAVEPCVVTGINWRNKEGI